MNVFCLGSEQIDSFWPEFGHLIEKFEVTRQTDYAGQLREDLRLAKKQLWGVQHDGTVRAILITRIAEQPRGDTCEIYATAGAGEADLPFNDQNVSMVLVEIERWARAIGCARIRIEGRKGWKRILNDYAEKGVILEKEI